MRVQNDNYLSNTVASNWSKLFFLQPGIDFDFDNKIIIDFGAGDGFLLKALHDRMIATHTQSFFIGVEQNPFLLDQIRLTMGMSPLCRLFASMRDLFDFFDQGTIDEIHVSLKGIPDVRILKPQVVLILSSVLHELSQEDQEQIAEFAKTYADYIIIRDMRPVSTLFTNEDVAKIVRYSNPKHLSDFIAKYGFDNMQILHYLLKYTYVDNWRAELEEDYTSVDWKLFLKLGTPIWIKDFLQKWREDRVFQDFGINLGRTGVATHRELIIHIRRHEVRKNGTKEKDRSHSHKSRRVKTSKPPSSSRPTDAAGFRLRVEEGQKEL